MYENFGFTRSAAGDQSITLFIPDNSVDATQYIRGTASHIASVSIVSDFQHLVNPGSTDWDPASVLQMTRNDHPNGYLFIYKFEPPLPDGWYQYQYLVGFDDTTVRLVGDPCTKYGGDTKDRSAFVVGGAPVVVTPIGQRLPSEALIIYELMIDDFTKEYRGTRAPIDAIQDKLDLLQGLNINAIEFMPWIAWPDDVAFSWGYDPAYFFSVESAYVSDPGNPLNRCRSSPISLQNAIGGTFMCYSTSCFSMPDRARLQMDFRTTGSGSRRRIHPLWANSSREAISACSRWIMTMPARSNL
jgi:hypothetical protein